jgi:type II secretory pathway pseudopilin PulG
MSFLFAHFTPFKKHSSKKTASSVKVAFVDYKKGMSIVEALVGTAVFIIVAVGVYGSFLKIFDAVKISHAKILAVALINEQFEVARNLPYGDVGIVSGLPVGKLQHEEELVRDGITFNVTRTVRNVDDDFDGTIGGTPNDLSPADYKIVEVEVNCTSCKKFTPISLTTNIAPKGLETASQNGALFVKVFDASGLPIQGADVHIENNQRIPSITIDDVTDVNGMLQVIDAPPGGSAYEITVSKSGYSTEQTYPIGGTGNPNPLKPHATVAIQQLTQDSFTIDRLSTLNIRSVDETCSPIGSIPFDLTGEKLIGEDPDVVKYDNSFTTDSNGIKDISGLEWDVYSADITDNLHDFLGIIPNFPLQLPPNTTQRVYFVLAPKDPYSLIISIKDSSTGLPISGADVNLSNTSAFDQTKISGTGSLNQTDWQGGGGQEEFLDNTKYFEFNGGIEDSDEPGVLKLSKIDLDNYNISGELVSSTFDTGSASNFQELRWEPLTQPVETGDDSVKFQVATNNDNLTWNFLGPDGTGSTYYTEGNQNINTVHNGNRYFRYKIFLNTTSTLSTPTVSDIGFTFTSECVPPGQVRFSNLNSGGYDLSISKNGYQNYHDHLNISNNTTREINLLGE